MKQTVSIFAPDINVASKSSAIQLWLNRKNQFFSSVLEEGVSNRQVLLLGHASFVFSALICASFVSQVPALICLAWFMVAFIIRKTKCFDFWERNVLFPKTKRSFFRTPKHPLPCPFPLNFSLLIITKKFGNLAKNRYICIV